LSRKTTLYKCALNFVDWTRLWWKIDTRYHWYLTFLTNLNKSRFIPRLIYKEVIFIVYVKERDKWKITYQIRYDHFEYNVMLFELIHTPSIFQYLKNDVFTKFLRKFVVYYLNDIFIYSKILTNTNNMWNLYYKNYKYARP